jgi:hypothetical protein
VSTLPRTIIYAQFAWMERFAAALLGAGTVTQIAGRLTERDLDAFPVRELAESEEQNARLIETLKRRPQWRRVLQRAARHAGGGEERLATLCSQRFILAHGRRLSQIRQLLSMNGEGALYFATDLPTALVEALLAERRWGAERLRIIGWASALLRALAFAADLARLTLIQLAATVRLLQLLALPSRPPGNRSTYAAWIGAGKPELSAAGPEAFSLVEFLAEGLSGKSVEEIVVQGTPPSVALPTGLRYRRTRCAQRWRPSLSQLFVALARQLARLLSDAAAATTWEQRQLVGPLLAALPGTLLWFECDPPVAVLYPNSMIGGEPLAAALAPRYGVRTMMVFYSANVAYASPPENAAVTNLEPEMRHIAADLLGMWSTDMRTAFETAGYTRERLPIVGVVHYGRQRQFRPSSRFVSPVSPGPVRVGVFDVSPLNPTLRFRAGYGQTLYNSAFCRAFFTDFTACAVERWGSGFVVVRKLKRRLTPGVHAADVDLAGIVPAAQICAAAPDANLWHLLGSMDLVICMPFTSVALMADHYGIPAAYYDPSGIARRSSLAGRAPLLSGRKALAEWLANPPLPPPHDPSINVAAETFKAACGKAWQMPRLQDAQSPRGIRHA